MTKIRAVLFDMIGTTVLENDPTVISSCFGNAFRENSVEVHDDQIQNVRGMDKLEAIELILKNSQSQLKRKSAIFESFKVNVRQSLQNFTEHHELQYVVKQLRERKIMIGIASGLPLDLFQMLIEKFRWQQYCFDYLDVYEKFPQGRPAPAMIFDMCKKLEIDPAELLKVGDTVADIEEGKNAGAITAAILAGTQPSSALKNASPDYLLATLGQVLDLVAKDNRA